MGRKRKNTGKPDEAPIYLRYQQVQEERSGYQRALKDLYDQQASTGFRPSINEVSRRIVDRKKPNNVVDRLIEKGKEIEERKRQLANERKNREKMMRKWKATEFEGNDRSDFFERQKKFLQKKEKKLNELKSGGRGEFRPRINLVSKVLAEEMRQEGGLEGPRWEQRLGDLEVRKNQIRREQRRRERIKKEGTFHPQINPISKRVAKKKSFRELTDTSARDKKLREKREQKRRREMEGCSFKPKINAKSGSTRKNIEQRIKDWERRKQEKLEMGKREREQRQMDECRFEPQLCHRPGQIPKQVQKERMLANIRGLGKFLENKEMAFRKQEEKEEAYREAFEKWGKGFTADVTKPEPFRLKTGKNRARVEVKEDERVFKPVTKNLIYQEVLDRFEDSMSD